MFKKKELILREGLKIIVYLSKTWNQRSNLRFKAFKQALPAASGRFWLI